MADSLSLPYCAVVVRLAVLGAAIALCGCAREAGPAHLPFDNAAGFLDGYSLDVPRKGSFLWNGAPVDRAVLRDYLHQYAAQPRGAGTLFVAFEPGVAQTRAEWVRRQVIDSGLCAQRRCAQIGWNEQRPVVN